MEKDLRLFQAFFLQDDAPGLLCALEQWDQPDLEVLLELLDRAAERPRTTACLLSLLREHFTPEEIAQNRRLRREKQLGLLDWEDKDWSALFLWEIADNRCRILSYLGGDEEVLIPE